MQVLFYVALVATAGGARPRTREHSTVQTSPVTSSLAEVLSAKSELFFEYLPPNQRDEAALKTWYPQISAISQGVALNVLSHIPKDSKCSVLDIGANVGSFTDQIIKERSNCHVTAFEPIEEIYSYNLDQHKGNSNIIVENFALCDATGSRTIWRSTKGNLGWNTLEKKPSSLSPEKIECKKFDEYAEAHGIMKEPFTAIKIDVEGAEWRVIRGMHTYLEQNRPIIAMEIGFGKKGHPNWKEEKEEIEWLFSHGYERMPYEFDGTTDVLFLPSGTNS